MGLTKVSGDVLQQPINIGIITATTINASTITGDGSQLSGIVTSVVAGENVNLSSSDGRVTITGLAKTDNTVADSLVVSGIATLSTVIVSGNVSIAGTLTYDDVTNIDSIGVVTARNGIDVNAGGIDAVGVVTATSFSGEDLLLSAIDTSLTDIAKDIFVYDTRKDSDGGAWRKRTQHTSWYNETLNTLHRGSRKEFPAVAIIVVEQNQVTIYDGDDPDLPIWMVFDQTIGRIFYINATCASMLNGKLVFGTDPNSADYYDGGIKVIDFISESIRSYSYASSIINYNLNISQRNENYTGVEYSNSYGVLTSPNVNDVAMTVLPNAPIDDATGLPVPTIAVGTDGGVSIIKDDGSVVDFTITTGTNNRGRRVDFTDDNRVVIEWDGATNGEITIDEIPSADTSANYPINLPGSYYNDHSPGSYTPNFLTEGPSLDYRHPTAIAQFRAVGTSVALSVFEENKASEEDGMVAFISSSYNTGYQQGRIKGAFLSDTDTTNATVGSAHYTETFTGSGDNTWNVAGSATISGGVLTLANAADSRATDLTATSSLTTGQNYIAEIEIVSNTSQIFQLDDDGAGAGQGGVTGYGICASGQTGTFLIGFTKTGSPRMRFLRLSGGPATITSFKIYTASEQDRSVNNNGLQVFGTITKSAVATGADLVAYSGFQHTNPDNYLKQPYNSDLDFGTDDFSVTWWQYITSDIADSEYVYDRQGGNGNRHAVYYTTANSGSLAFYTNAGSSSEIIATGINSYKDGWACYTISRRSSGLMQIYINGELKQSSTLAVRNLTNTSAELFIGIRHSVDTGAATQAKLALMRFSKTIPSDEQIKKIYEDEKVLFQENSKATLYGSSNNVTALGYDEDTELLHVGTSAGRSDFQGLRRINNTTTAVTTAISASDDLIAEQ